MRKKIIIAVISIALIIAYGVYWSFYDLNRIPKGKEIASEVSPNGTYTVKAYISNGGATTSYSVLGVLKYNKVKEREKNIYWNYKEENAEIKWIDDDTVIINGHLLNVMTDTFDFRRNSH